MATSVSLSALPEPGGFRFALLDGETATPLIDFHAAGPHYARTVDHEAPRDAWDRARAAGGANAALADLLCELHRSRKCATRLRAFLGVE